MLFFSFFAEHVCLPHKIQVMREEVVPYVVSCVFLGSCAAIVAAYGIYRKLNVKKASYGFYGDGGPPDGQGGGDVFAEEGTEAHEMGQVKTNGAAAAQQQQQQNGYEAEAEANGVGTELEEAPGASNPFKKKPASNPFNQ